MATVVTECTASSRVIEGETEMENILICIAAMVFLAPFAAIAAQDGGLKVLKELVKCLLFVGAVLAWLFAGGYFLIKVTGV